MAVAGRKHTIAMERRIQYYPKDMGTATLLCGVAQRHGGFSAAISAIVSDYISRLSEKEKEEFKKIGSKHKKVKS